MPSPIGIAPRLACLHPAPGAALVWAESPPEETRTLQPEAVISLPETVILQPEALPRPLALPASPSAARREGLVRAWRAAGRPRLDAAPDETGAPPIPLREITLLNPLSLAPGPLAALLDGLANTWPRAAIRLVLHLDSPPRLLAGQPGSRGKRRVTAQEAREWGAREGVSVLVSLSSANGLTQEEGLIQKLRLAGLPLGGEILLVKGVNDSIPVLRELCLALSRAGVRPYAMLDSAFLDTIPVDTGRVETVLGDSGRALPRQPAPSQGEALVRGLRGHISGVAVPQWVREGINGFREVVVPPYVEQLDGLGAAVRGFQGGRHRYPDPPLP